MTLKKRLIEYDLPLADISEASAREKNIRYGHPSTLHIWWARRPLPTSLRRRPNKMPQNEVNDERR